MNVGELKDLLMYLDDDLEVCVCSIDADEEGADVDIVVEVGTAPLQDENENTLEELVVLYYDKNLI